mgnify:CR=1 FL=1
MADFEITDADLHPHLRARMLQRGITLEELQSVFSEGWDASGTKPGVIGKTRVFPYQAIWEDRFYEEKEVTLYYKIIDRERILLTAKARYGKSFPGKER